MEDETRARGHISEGSSAPRTWLKWVLFALWLPLVLAATIAPVLEQLSTPDSLWDNRLTRVGLWTRAADGVLYALSPEARSSGFESGAEILAVDGRPFTKSGPDPFSRELGTLLNGPEGTKVYLTSRAPDGTIREHVLTRTRAHTRAFFERNPLSPTVAQVYLDLRAYVGAWVFVLAAILLFVKGGWRPVPMMLTFALLFLCIAWYGVEFLLTLPDGGLWRTRILITGWQLLVFAMMLFPDGRFAPPWMRWVGALFGLYSFYLAVAFSGLSLAPIPPRMGGLITLSFALIAVGSLILRYRRLPVGSERQQIRWALFGFAAAAVLLTAGNVLENLVLPKVPSPSVWLSLFLLDMLVFAALGLIIAAGLAVSLLRYRLYDADAVISRSVAFGMLTLILLGVFAGTEKVIELLGEEWFGEELGVLAGGIGAALAAVMIVPLHHRLTHWAEHKFQKQLIRLRTGLPDLVGDMRETAPIARIAAAVLDNVSRGVRASRAALIMDNTLVGARGIEQDEVVTWLSAWSPDTADGFDVDRSDLTFPLRIPLEADGHGRVGWLLLGPRPDGSFYGKDERETLTQIADPVARALEIAQRREAREAVEREAWAAQERLNAGLLQSQQRVEKGLAGVETSLGLIESTLRELISTSRPEAAE